MEAVTERTRLALWRAHQKLTMREASDLTGLSPSMWSRLESGERRASRELKLRISRALGVPISELFEVDQ